MGEKGGSVEFKGFAGPYSIYCDESGENVVDLLEGDDFARTYERSESVQEYEYEPQKEKAEEKLKSKESAMIVSDVPKFDAACKKTKIVCAIGPSSRSVEMLLQLLEAGMNVARLNFSHGDHAYHLESLRNLRLAVQLRRSWGIECHCATLLDTKGPEIRTGYLQDGQPIQLNAGQLLEITSDYSYKGNSKRIACSYKELSTSVKEGGTILVADGEIMMDVLECKPEEELVVVRVQNSAVLEERKNMNLPGVTVKLPGITEKDMYDIVSAPTPAFLHPNRSFQSLTFSAQEKLRLGSQGGYRLRFFHTNGSKRARVEGLPWRRGEKHPSARQDRECGRANQH